MCVISLHAVFIELSASIYIYPHTMHCISLKNLIFLQETILLLLPIILPTVISGQPAHSYYSYQKGTFCNPSTEIKRPQTPDQVIQLVQSAVRLNQQVKPLGNRFSNTDIICTDGIPVDMTNINHIHFDPKTGSVTAGAGTLLVNLAQFLHKVNRTLIHFPSFGRLTVGGVLGGGSQGSSLLHPTSIGDLVTQVKLVDGMGTVQVITDPEDLPALQMNLGLLGILLEVTMKTVPLFKITFSNELHEERVLHDGSVLKWARSFDAFSFWWFPSSSSVVTAQGVYEHSSNGDLPRGNAKTHLIPEQSSLSIAGGFGLIETLQASKSAGGLKLFESFTKTSLYAQVPGRQPVYSSSGFLLENPATGFASDLLMSTCWDKCAWENGDFSLYPEESSVAFDISELPRVLKMIKSVLDQEQAFFYMIGIFFRFSGKSGGLLSPNFRNESFTIDLVAAKRKNPFEDPKFGMAAYQAILQAMVNEHGGTPHWCKNGLYYFSPEVLDKVWGINSNANTRRAKFISVMKKFDPNGIFLNKFGQRLLGNSSEVDKHPKVSHCALQDFCVCSSPSDCANGQLCSSINNYSVCKDSSNARNFLQKLPRSLISSLNT